MRTLLVIAATTVFAFARVSAAAAAPWPEAVACAGDYAQHLQGVCAADDTFYWCFTSALVKTDRDGQVVKEVAVADHHGDLCHHDGRIYVAVNLGQFNRAPGKADSWVYVYAADDLSFIARHAVPEVVHGAGGMAYHDGRFFVVGGLPEGVAENYVYEYDADFRLLKRHVLRSGHTLKGIQTAAFADGRWWFGCYGGSLLQADAALKNVERFEFDCALGIVPSTDGKFLIARGGRTNDKRYTGRLVTAQADVKLGLVIMD